MILQSKIIKLWSKINPWKCKHFWRIYCGTI